MMCEFRRPLWSLPGVVLALALSAPCYCGDEDQAPAYRIYIDPETGAYTTDDPLLAAAPAAVKSTVPVAKDRESAAPLTIAGVLVVLLAAGIIFRRRKRVHPR